MAASTTANTALITDGILVTQANRELAAMMGQIIERGELVHRVTISTGKKSETFEQPNPSFLALLQRGRTPREVQANARAFLDLLESNPELRVKAEQQGIDPAEWEEQLPSILEQVADDRALEAGNADSD